MREVKSLAGTLKETIAGLRQKASKVTSEFKAEIDRAHDNMSKVASVTTELKDANKEVEAELGLVGSNFPTNEEPTEEQAGSSNADINGVTKHGTDA